MRYRYSEWNGKEFDTQDHLEFFDRFMDIVLEYGDQAFEALKYLDKDNENSDLLDKLIDEGFLEKTRAQWRLTPRAVNAIQRKALMEIFSRLNKGYKPSHPSPESGQGGERIEGTKPYVFGDPISELELSATMRNAIKRGNIRLPLKITEKDFEIHQSEHYASCSTAILLDMSGSMARYHRFYHAKKCAMALHALIRQRFPMDTVDLVGFYSSAAIIPEYKLPLTNPKPVTLFDYQVRLKVPINQIDQAPQHFTNLHMGLSLAKRILARRGGDNKQIFIITDGEPTAHVQGEYIHLRYPPEQVTSMATLQEAIHITRQGIRICTFALTEDYAYLDWVGFVDQLTRITKGVAFYTASGELSGCLMESYLSGRKQRTYIA